MARKVLWGGLYTPNPNHSVDYLVDVMPCDNSYNWGNASWGHLQWSTVSRLEHPEEVGLSSNNPPGEVSAIDFLLYHNLWYIHQLQEGNDPHIQDLSNIIVDQSGGNFQSNIDAYETIDASNTNLVSLPNDVYWRAGKTISLKPGAYVPKNYHMYIDHYTCATDVGHARTANTDSIPNDSINISNSQPFHYVNYPPVKEQLVVQQTNATTLIDPHFVKQVVELPVSNDFFKNNIKNIVVIPSYSKDLVKLYFDLNEKETAQFNVVSVDGKVILERKNLNKNETGLKIDLTENALGVYFLNFITSEGISKSIKIVRE